MGKREKPPRSKTSTRKRLQLSSKAEMADRSIPSVSELDAGCVKVEANMQEKNQETPAKLDSCSSSMDSSVNDTPILPTVEGHDKSSQNSERPAPIVNHSERLPPVRFKTRLHRERSPEVDGWSGWQKITRPALRDVYHPDYPFTMKDPYVQPQRVIELPRFTQECRDFEGFAECVYPSHPDEKIHSLTASVNEWALDYCGSPEEIEKRMTAEQKQAIVDFLGDWCLYKDWDSLIATFPNQTFRHAVFTQAVILKDIFQSLVENPFYYMDLGTHWDGESETLPPTYGKELYQHWQKLLRVDEIGAEKWRTKTVQMMNRYLEPKTGPTTAPIHPVEAWDTTTGIRSWNIRQRYVNRLVRNMLDQSSLISPMLLDQDPKKELKSDEPFRREGLLRRCYDLACDFGVQLWVNDLSFRFDENINEIGPYTKSPAWRHSLPRHKRWWAGGQYHSDGPVDCTMDNDAGRQTVVIFWPTIWCVWSGQDGKKKLYDNGDRKGIEQKEWIYVDDRDWFYSVLASGHVYIAGKGKVKPDHVSPALEGSQVTTQSSPEFSE